MAIFTAWGQENYHPERDIPLYIVFCGLTFAACYAMMLLWNRRYASLSPENKYRFTVGNIAANLTLALTATLVNPLWFFTAKRLARMLRPHWVAGELVMTLPVWVEIACFLWLLGRNGMESGFLARVRRMLETLIRKGEENRPCSNTGDSPAAGTAWNWRDAGFLFLIWLFFYSPRADIMAGFVFQSEHFHHWDYFVTAPALGYIHGQALNTQVYSQYGIGFPLLFALLNPIYRLSYGHIFQFTNIYTCFYLCGVYLFLRLLLRSPRWAALGAFIFAFYKLFNWTTVWFPPYQLPSNTVLRGPFDIWFLLVLLLHQQSRRMGWLLFAGALAGLSLLFETDTGVYITFTFVVYSVFYLRGVRREAHAGSFAGRMAMVGGAWLLFSGMFLSGMAIASRGTIGQAAFWRGWIECFTAYPNGLSMVPVAQYMSGMFYGMILVGVYLFALCYYFHRLHERQDEKTISADSAEEISTDEGEESSAFRPHLALLCVALYGTCSMLHFMGRSHPTNLHVGFLGFLLLGVTGLHTLTQYALRGGQEYFAGIKITRIGWGACCLFGLFTWWHEPHVRAYPNCIRLLLKPDPPREISLYIDDSGRKGDPHVAMWPRFVGHVDTTAITLYPGSGVTLPRSVLPKLQQYAPVIEEARQWESQGKKVAILANDETWLYLASGATPWFRYSPLYPNLMTKAQLTRAESALLADRVDYVCIEAATPSTTFVAWHPLALYTTDVWRELRQFTARHYTFDHTAGIYEVWKR